MPLAVRLPYCGYVILAKAAFANRVLPKASVVFANRVLPKARAAFANRVLPKARAAFGNPISLDHFPAYNPLPYQIQMQALY